MKKIVASLLTVAMVTKVLDGVVLPQKQQKAQKQQKVQKQQQIQELCRIWENADEITAMMKVS